MLSKQKGMGTPITDWISKNATVLFFAFKKNSMSALDL